MKSLILLLMFCGSAQAQTKVTMTELSTTTALSFPQSVTASSFTAVSVTISSITSVFGTWTSKSPDTVYRATTDGFVMGDVLDGTFSCVTDSSNPPTTVRMYSAGGSNVSYGNRRASMTCPIRKNDYFKMVTNAGTAPTVWWLGIGGSGLGGGGALP